MVEDDLIRPLRLLYKSDCRLSIQMAMINISTSLTSCVPFFELPMTVGLFPKINIQDKKTREPRQHITSLPWLPHGSGELDIFERSRYQ